MIYLSLIAIVTHILNCNLLFSQLWECPVEPFETVYEFVHLCILKKRLISYVASYNSSSIVYSILPKKEKQFVQSALS